MFLFGSVHVFLSAGEFRSLCCMVRDVKDVGSGDDTSECGTITALESRTRIVWCGACVRAVLCYSVAILRRFLEALWQASTARVASPLDTYSDAS